MTDNRSCSTNCPKINLLDRYYSGGATPPGREDAAQTGKFEGQRGTARGACYHVGFRASTRPTRKSGRGDLAPTIFLIEFGNLSINAI